MRPDARYALVALRRLGWNVGPEAFARYAKAADSLAREEIRRTPLEGRGLRW